MNAHIDRKYYHEVLKEEFRPFAFFFEELAKSKSDVNFFRIITQNFVPLIKGSPQIKPLYEKWIEEKKAFESKLLDVQTKTSNQLEEIYKVIRTKLECKKLLDNSEISACITFIESYLNLGKSLRTFRYYQNFSNQLKKLFHVILNLGETKIVEPFANIGIVEEYSFQRLIGHTNGLHIASFEFNSLIIELAQVEQISDWKTVSKPWTAFDKLLRAESAWNSQKQDFENNGQIQEYVEWKDMENLKNPIHSEKPLFFVSKNFIDYIQILLHEIILYQESAVSQKTESLNTTPTPKIHSLKLFLEDSNNLCIDVTWKEGLSSEKIHLRRFYEESLPRDFIQALLTRSLGETINISQEGGSIAKHIEELRLNGLLSHLFILRKSMYAASLKANPVYLKDNDIDNDQLYQEINNIKEQNLAKKAKQKRTSK